MRRKEVSIECKHSPSCFTCPLKDCRVNAAIAAQVNTLETDKTIFKELSNEAQSEKFK